MLYLLRHIASVLALPTTATVLIPVWIARTSGVAWLRPASAGAAAVVFGGLLLLAAGAALFSWTLRLFFTRGRGTLAPWDPPTRFVAIGPYRHVRNPMITGIVLVLLGEALTMRSQPHAVWAAVFALMNVVYIPLIEEPGLERRFGRDYTLYRENVPRFVPRLTGWTG
jgi:protein-S-isoprenylcysteine O-methyltransferase Ste14